MLTYEPSRTVYIIGQALGIVVIIVSVFVYLAKKRENMLIIKLSTDVLNVVQQAMIGAMTGSLINGIAIFRELVFYNRGKKKWASHWAWLIVFLLAMVISPILTWQGPVSLLPALGSAAAVVGFYVTNPHVTRQIALLAQGLWLTYSILTLNAGAIVTNVLVLGSAIIGLIRDAIDAKKNKKLLVVESTAESGEQSTQEESKNNKNDEN